MRRVFVRFLEEIEDFKKAFRNYLTFNRCFHVQIAQKSLERYLICLLSLVLEKTGQAFLLSF